jgi:hypothetical protein
MPLPRTATKLQVETLFKEKYPYRYLNIPDLTIRFPDKSELLHSKFPFHIKLSSIAQSYLHPLPIEKGL